MRKGVCKDIYTDLIITYPTYLYLYVYLYIYIYSPVYYPYYRIKLYVGNWGYRFMESPVLKLGNILGKPGFRDCSIS